jgi:histidinol dehydrogenase
VLVTDSPELISKVQTELDRQVAGTENIERVKASLSGIQSALVLVPNLDTAVAVSNEYATEHLEIHVREPDALLPRLTNAGAIFLGENSPVSLGDYLAGSNHVLPTGEQAKFGPGLGVHTFLRPQQIINYSKAALESVADQLETFAIAEGLSAHGDAAKIRFNGGN